MIYKRKTQQPKFLALASPIAIQRKFPPQAYDVSNSIDFLSPYMYGICLTTVLMSP